MEEYRCESHPAKLLQGQRDYFLEPISTSALTGRGGETVFTVYSA